MFLCNIKIYIFERISVFMKKLFGTDGVRGIVGEDISCELAMQIGKATAYVLKKRYNCHQRPLNILIGRDTRVTGHMLESAFIAGACYMGANCHMVGIISTPAISLLVPKYKFEVGVIISASHNPFKFNGIKIFNRNGFKLSDSLETEIEKCIFGVNEEFNKAKASDFGTRLFCKTAFDDYVNYIASTVKQTDLSGVRVAVDCANGSAFKTAVSIFNKLNIDADFFNISPNGLNINENCGSTHIENFAKDVKNGKYDLGVAFDGDADRCLAVDENGGLVDGDQLIAIFARCMKDAGALKKNTVVVTVMSNLGFFNFARENDINLEVTQVGDRYVLQNMIEKGYKIGGEQSGHIIFKDYANTGDGQLTAVQLIKFIKDSNKSFSSLKNLMKKFPQVLVNVAANIQQKEKYFNSTEIGDYIQEKEKMLGDDSRIVVRCSGTEPIIRVMIEGPNKDLIEKTSKEVANRISEMVRV